MIALDNLDPANANLMLLRKGGKPVTVAQGVGRVFDIGEDFVVCTQTTYTCISGTERYALTEGQKGLLSRSRERAHHRMVRRQRPQQQGRYRLHQQGGDPGAHCWNIKTEFSQECLSWLLF